MSQDRCNLIDNVREANESGYESGVSFQSLEFLVTLRAVNQYFVMHFFLFSRLYLHLQQMKKLPTN